MNWLTDPQVWLAFLTLTTLEIVLGIDNIVFLVLVTNRLPEAQQKPARRLGLVLAMLMRLLLLSTIVWIAQLTTPLFSIDSFEVSIRDILMLGGGLFLLVKGILEILAHHPVGETLDKSKAHVSFSWVVCQILLLDIIFSLDSVITAVALTQDFMIMAAAIITAVLVMLCASEPVNRFIRNRPRMQILALAFILLIGLILVGEGLHLHFDRSYLYAMMGFALFVEFLGGRVTPSKK